MNTNKNSLKNHSKHLTFFALTESEQANNTIQILPYGWVVTDKGKFLVDEQAMKMIVTAFEQKKNETVIDYEHQTLKDVIAPAAAWIKKLENRGKNGLWAEVEWTPRALEFVKNKEYRYLSPVIFSRKSDGRAIILHSCGLTNTPAIDGMEPIANKEEDVQKMDELLKKLITLLGLGEDADEAAITQEINKLKEKATACQPIANKEILSLLDIDEKATLADVKGKIIALKNPSGYVKAEEFKALQEKIAMQERDELVQTALKSGKVSPAQKEWAEQYALKDQEGFKSFLEHAPAVVPVASEVAGGSVKRTTVTDDMQISINKALGIDEETFKKHGGNE